ncbi:hypothetical protein, partial [Teichococcus aestuarii]|uniref:hypothetical protein n=1 Tax=Teichococcus aestuarii TaxID=568898 RepID=UPI0036234974
YWSHQALRRASLIPATQPAGTIAPTPRDGTRPIPFEATLRAAALRQRAERLQHDWRALAGGLLFELAQGP